MFRVVKIVAELARLTVAAARHEGRNEDAEATDEPRRLRV